MANVFDVTPTHFDRSIRPVAPADAVRVIDGRPWFHCRQVVEAWTNSAVEKARDALEAAAAVDVDPLLAAGGDGSPNLERYRAARAGLAEMELAERRGELVRAALIRSAFAQVLADVGEGVALLVRKHGNDVAEVMDERLDRCLEKLTVFFKQLPDDQATANAKPSAEPITGRSGRGCKPRI